MNTFPPLDLQSKEPSSLSCRLHREQEESSHSLPSCRPEGQKCHGDVSDRFNDASEVDGAETFTHQNIHIQAFPIVLLVFFLDLFHVDFRAAHHDAGQDVLTRPFAL